MIVLLIALPSVSDRVIPTINMRPATRGRSEPKCLSLLVSIDLVKMGIYEIKLTSSESAKFTTHNRL